MASDTSMEDLQISYEGASSLIEANTLINTLLQFTNIVHETNKELNPEAKVEVKIKAHKEGSFLVDLVVMIQSVDPNTIKLFADSLGYAKTLVDTVGGIYSLVKFLKGEKPKEIERVDNSVKIENNNGEVTFIDNRVYNIYNDNARVNNAITQEFKSLAADQNITALRIIGKDKKAIVTIPQEDFAQIASGREEFISPNEKLLTKIGILYIVSLSFERNANWTFIFEGNKFSAKIKDEVFTKLIDSGEAFSKGDCLEAEFEIRQQFDETLNTWLNKSLKVNRIIKHILRNEQKKLFHD